MRPNNFSSEPRRMSMDGVPLVRGTTLRHFAGYPELLGTVVMDGMGSSERQMAEFTDKAGNKFYADIRTGTLYSLSGGTCLSSTRIHLVHRPKATGRKVPAKFYKEGEGAADAPEAPAGEDEL